MNLADLTWPAVQALGPDVPIVVPVAAVEQHGRHMPLCTDSALLAEVVRRVELRLHDRILVAPLLWLGNSHHHLDFPGTLSAPPRAYLDLLNGLLDNLVGHGFRRILILNGHGGNDTPGKQAVFESRQKYRDRKDLLLLFATYWSLGGRPELADPGITQTRMGHACEWETSMMLRLSPHLVGDLTQTWDVPFGNPFEPAARGWVTAERTPTGHIGDPRSATAAKGEVLFQTFADDAVALLNRVLAWDGRSWDG
jgi:creatinine amidohydrolase